uniref:Uncharacterized protein n=1 Tax=viral metagenome TaxID=1070528 RepID=A0A6C0IG47_9ZZZZ
MRTNWLFTPYSSINPDNRPLYIKQPQVNVYDKISENLFVGGIESSQKRWNEFKLIVNCTKDIPFPSQNKGLNNPECIRIPVNDTPDECDNMTKYMMETNVLQRISEYIRKGEPVLVHCYAGMQRSCALIACYLIKYYGVTPVVAMDHIKRHRPVAFFGGANFMKTIQNQTNNG